MSKNEDGRDPKTGQFLPGNSFAEGKQHGLVHGGEGAVKAIQRGEPFRGLAQREEQTVQADYAEQGRAAMVEENAVRLQTACRLYWNAVQKAADDGDLVKLDSYIARFGWLAGASLRAWAELRKEEKSKPKSLDYNAFIQQMKDESKKEGEECLNE